MKMNTIKKLLTAIYALFGHNAIHPKSRCNQPRITIRINKNMMMALMLLVLTGCGVPKTHMHVKIGNTDFDWRCPKQFIATNIVAQVHTNGTASFSVGYVESKNDPVVIDKASAGDVARIKATGDFIQTLGETASKLKP